MLQTDRLILRRWRDQDREPFAALNADPDVMHWFPSTLTHAESDAMVDRIEASFDDRGYGLWAAEVKGSASKVGIPFIGFIGLAYQSFPAHFTPAVEVGWRLAKAHWGNGYAPEGARAALDVAFDVLGLDAVVSMTTVGNEKSRRVMEKIGMTRDPADDFEHPNDTDERIRPHVHYRINKVSRSTPGTPAA
jgi:ribosomal-protein-alanine N-acetyltransferase